MDRQPTLIDVYRAHARIKPMIFETPLIEAAELAQRTGAQSVHLKLECLQNTGAFKVRGAANKILSLRECEKKRGVITFSTGNHGKAVAYVAGKTGMTAVVCLSEHVAPYRAETISRLGAEVSIRGRSQDEAEENYRQLASERGLVPVVPFDDSHIIAGQGTIALEILSRMPETDMLLIPISGGGLMAGMAMTAKSINPDIRIVGLSLERSPAMLKSLEAGSPVQVEEKDSVADSLLGGIGFDNRYTFSMVNRYADEHILVFEEEIEEGMRHIFTNQRLIAEGAAALGVGALLHRRLDVRNRRVVALLSGSSVDPDRYIKILQKKHAIG